MKYVFQKLWPELKPFSWRILSILLLGAAVSGLKATSPEILRRLQMAWQSGDETLAFQLPWVLAATWMLSGIARYYHMYWMMYISDLVAVNLRRKLMDKYLSLNLSFFQNFVRGSGGLISRMLNDIVIIQSGIHKVADIVREPFMAFFSFAYLLYLDWKLTLFIIVALPPITYVLRKLSKSLRKYGHRNQESMEDLAKILKESLDGTRIVQSFNLQDEMRARFDHQAEDYLASKRKIISREEASGPITESLAAFTIATILIYFGSQILQSKLTIADFIGFSFAIGLLQDSIKKIQGGDIKLQMAAVALERLHQILDNTNVVPETSAPVSFPEKWDRIEFDNVSFAYGEKAVLKNINLNIQRGEIIALVGASGGGKSTMANLLGRFFDPLAGEIRIGGVPLTKMRLNDLRAHVALVSQDVFLFGESIERNIHAGDFSKDPAGIMAAAKLANAHEFILRTSEGYKSRVGDLGSTLSGGEKQRISIARAIFKDAPLLILDEATSALDSENELEVQKGLDSLLTGRTALVIAHRLSTIAKADRILVLKDGQIAEQGSHEQLLAIKGEYFRYHQLQARI